jgi:hypothetical protein
MPHLVDQSLVWIAVRWVSLYQALVWIVLRKETLPQQAEEIANSTEMQPEIEQAFNELQMAYFRDLLGLPEGVPIDKFGIRHGRHVSLLPAVQWPATPGAQSMMLYELKNSDWWKDFVCNPYWLKRVWPAPVPATSTLELVANTGSPAADGEAAPAAKAPASADGMAPPVFTAEATLSESNSLNRSNLPVMTGLAAELAGVMTWLDRPKEPSAPAAPESMRAAPPTDAEQSDQLQAIKPFHSGGPGRPTATEVVINEGMRRIEKGEVKPTERGLTKFAEDLHEWWGIKRQTYDPIAPTVGISTICNGLRTFWNSKLSPNASPDR